MHQPVATIDKVIHARPEKVWSTMIENTSAMFMGATVTTDWKIGHPITFSGEWKGKPFEDHGVIRTIERMQKLSFTHYSPLSGKPDAPENYNLVTCVLEPKDEADTKVTLTQTPMGDEEVSEERKSELRKTWSAMLQGLKAAAEGRAA